MDFSSSLLFFVVSRRLRTENQMSQHLQDAFRFKRCTKFFSLLQPQRIRLPSLVYCLWPSSCSISFACFILFNDFLTTIILVIRFLKEQVNQIDNNKTCTSIISNIFSFVWVHTTYFFFDSGLCCFFFFSFAVSIYRIYIWLTLN